MHCTRTINNNTTLVIMRSLYCSPMMHENTTFITNSMSSIVSRENIFFSLSSYRRSIVASAATAASSSVRPFTTCIPSNARVHTSSSIIAPSSSSSSSSSLSSSSPSSSSLISPSSSLSSLSSSSSTTSSTTTSSLSSSSFSSFLTQSNRSFSTPTQVGAPLRKKVTSIDLIAMRRRQQRISMVTAYTYPSAIHVDAAGIDVILVGDSVGMVELGYDSTLPVTMDDLIYHCKAVSRGADRALLIADLPFGSYESSPSDAYKSAIRFLKEANMDAVKMEGGAEYAPHVRACVNGGVAVMGHIGLTPQRISTLGGFRAQGKTLIAAQKLLTDAIALQDAGAFAIVIECVPSEVAKFITDSIQIPTIGIGAGNGTNGQVLVYHDLLGMYQHAHHAKVTPSFCKRYGRIGEEIQKALNEYKEEVTNDQFPGHGQYAPYQLLEEEKIKFREWAQEQTKKRENVDAATTAATATATATTTTTTATTATTMNEKEQKQKKKDTSSSSSSSSGSNNSSSSSSIANTTGGEDDDETTTTIKVY